MPILCILIRETSRLKIETYDKGEQGAGAKSAVSTLFSREYCQIKLMKKAKGSKSLFSGRIGNISHLRVKTHVWRESILESRIFRKS